MKNAISCRDSVQIGLTMYHESLAISFRYIYVCNINVIESVTNYLFSFITVVIIGHVHSYLCSRHGEHNH